jgi:hypothetical protein
VYLSAALTMHTDTCARRHIFRNMSDTFCKIARPQNSTERLSLSVSFLQGGGSAYLFSKVCVVPGEKHGCVQRQIWQAVRPRAYVKQTHVQHVRAFEDSLFLQGCAQVWHEEDRKENMSSAQRMGTISSTYGGSQKIHERGMAGASDVGGPAYRQHLGVSNQGVRIVGSDNTAARSRLRHSCSNHMHTAKKNFPTKSLVMLRTRCADALSAYTQLG